jgi:hypothetical protein
MKRGRRVFLVLVACGVVAVVAALVWPREREPEYQGKKLSEWLEKNAGTLWRCGFREGAEAQEVRRAVEHMGTNCLPFLLRWICDAGERPWGGAAVGAVERVCRGSMFGDREARGFTAVWGFHCLGARGRPAIPELVLMTESTNVATSQMAAYAMGEIGGDAVPALLNMVTNRPLSAERYVRLRAAWWRVGKDARSAAPVLVGLLKDEDELVASLSANLLGDAPVEPEIAVPALTEGVRGRNARVRRCAMYSLGQFGEQARPAVTALVGELDNPEEGVREDATNALRKIAPEVLENGHFGKGTSGERGTVNVEH